MRSIIATLAAFATPALLSAQTPRPFTHADTLRGSITPQRAWWDVTFYDLHVSVTPADSSIRGWNGITYRVLSPGRELQIDLQEPLVVDSMVQDRARLTTRRDGNAFFVSLAADQRTGTSHTVTVYYHGKPKIARNPPWDGGLIMVKDSAGNRWIATANEGLGASVWWPNKDSQADEPDSQRVAITVPDPMVDISNGRLRSTTHHPDGTTTFEWFVREPINNYDIAINAGVYAHFADTVRAEKGPLTMDYWPLAIHADTAKVQLRQAKSMITCFEHWFGPYPWYVDGYKLVEAPHLGMEHQSAVAYGNGYKNGYRGRDLSNTGHGLKWDFIVVHESAHEWFGNSITSKDVADMWVHESFANYAEGIYTECQEGKKAGDEYIIGSRRNIRNDTPIISAFGVNKEGSGDMYYKGGAMLQMIREIIGDDEKWRGVLRGLSETFRHQTVTGLQVQDYIDKKSGIDFSPVFAQYLTTTKVPVLEYRIDSTQLSVRWTEVVDGFNMPVRVSGGDSTYTLIRPTTAWKTLPARALAAPVKELRPDPAFYIKVKKVSAVPGRSGS